MKKRTLVLCLTIALSAMMAVSGTLAYLQDQDEAVNVMTLGNVYIEQHEYERAKNADGTFKTETIDNETSYVLKNFTQAKPLFPAVIPTNSAEWAYGPTNVMFKQIGANGGGMQVFTEPNAVDKFVFVENTGKSDAYVRTLIAYEAGSCSVEEWSNLIKSSYHFAWAETCCGLIEVNGNHYVVYEYVYEGRPDKGYHINGILPAGEVTQCSLGQVYMKSNAGNADVEALDGNKNGTYDILVVSQAVQTAGFDSAEAALNTAFGDISAEITTDEGQAKIAGWFGNAKFPEIFSWEGVNYVTEGDTVQVSSNGGDTIYRGILSDGKTDATTVKIDEGIVRLNNRALAKAPTIQEVSLPSTLTYIDESVFQQSGFTSIEIPENVTYIGKQAFGACGSLETIVVSAKDVTIANYVARACANLKEVYINSDKVTFESGSMYFTTKENGDASGITFFVKDQAIADQVYTAFSTSHSYGLLIKSLDGATTFYNTLK